MPSLDYFESGTACLSVYPKFLYNFVLYVKELRVSTSPIETPKFCNEHGEHLIYINRNFFSRSLLKYKDAFYYSVSYTSKLQKNIVKIC